MPDVTRWVSGDMATLDPVLLSPGEELCLTDAPDPAYQMGFRSNPELFDPVTGASFGRGGNFVSAKVIPSSHVGLRDLLLVVAFNREESPSHALVVANDHVGWIVLEHLRPVHTDPT